MTRSVWVLVHRYCGLSIAFFLVIAGLTGTVIAFYYELDEWLNPDLYQAEAPHPNAQLLHPLGLRETLEMQLPDAWVHFAPLRVEPGRSVIFYVEGEADPATGKHVDIGFSEVFVDPYTGAIVGARQFGDLGQGLRLNLIPFLYKLHYSLALPGAWGRWIMGIAALIWTFDCFVGAYLTFPRARQRPNPGKSFGMWLRRWGRAWRISPQARLFPMSFDIHLAFGLWLWGLLLVFAWSSVALNLGSEVYRPVMSTFFEFQDPYSADPPLPQDRPTPGIPWVQARAIGMQLMQEQSDRMGFSVLREERLHYNAHSGVYRYIVRSDRDLMDRYPVTTVFFDANTGAFRQLHLPTGQYSGNTVTHWLQALHYGAVFGLPYRVLVALVGTATAVVTISGLILWWIKRGARRRKRNAESTYGTPEATFGGGELSESPEGSLREETRKSYERIRAD